MNRLVHRRSADPITASIPLLVLALFAPPSLHAVDGVVEIDQLRAAAGGVTPGDLPGFPVSISLPGSYRLTGNLDVSAETIPQDTTAIEILSSFVTLDLNGFALSGSTVCSGSPVTSCAPLGTGDGISARTANLIRILNGTVRGFGDAGVDAGGATLENVQAFGNGTRGISVASGGTVSRCSASGNGARGITGSGILVETSRALDNGTVGIRANAGEVRDCESVHNGSHGIEVLDGLVLGSVSRGNLGLPIVATRSGYASNNASGATTPEISGGVSLGKNLCNGALCP